MSVDQTGLHPTTSASESMTLSWPTFRPCSLAILIKTRRSRILCLLRRMVNMFACVRKAITIIAPWDGMYLEKVNTTIILQANKDLSVCRYRICIREMYWPTYAQLICSSYFQVLCQSALKQLSEAWSRRHFMSVFFSRSRCLSCINLSPVKHRFNFGQFG